MAEFSNVTIPHWQFSTESGSSPVSYCNGAQVAYSPWDFSFEFMHLTARVAAAPPPTEGGPTEETEAAPAEPETQATGGSAQVSVTRETVSRLVMSPQHAKAFLGALQQNVDGYEAQYGAIPVIQPEAASGGETSAG